MMDEYSVKQIKLFKYLTIISLLVIGFFFSYFEFISPMIDVYQARKQGEAELARADSNRKIKIREAEADQEAAVCLAQAEITRAEGVAKANQIIGESLKGNESYLRYRWIEGLQTNQMQTIYIPTEAGLPILEANPNIRR